MEIVGDGIRDLFFPLCVAADKFNDPLPFRKHELGIRLLIPGNRI